MGGASWDRGPEDFNAMARGLWRVPWMGANVSEIRPDHCLANPVMVYRKAATEFVHLLEELLLTYALNTITTW